MKFGVYVLKDNKSYFDVPECKLNDQQALRDFAYRVNQPNLMAFKPEDFSYWKIGTYDNETAVFELLKEKELLCEATQVIERKVNNGIS